jgi:hypothetical protein
MPSGTTNLAAFAVAGLIVICGFYLLLRMPKDHPLSPYSMQVLALVVILPGIVLLGLQDKFNNEVPTAVATIIGFFFGHALGVGRGRGRDSGG